MEVIMSLNFFFLMYEVVRLVVCQSFLLKKQIKIIPRKCKRPFFEKRNCDFLNCRNMIVLFTLFIDLIIKL